MRKLGASVIKARIGALVASFLLIASIGNVVMAADIVDKSLMEEVRRSPNAWHQITVELMLTSEPRTSTPSGSILERLEKEEKENRKASAPLTRKLDELKSKKKVEFYKSPTGGRFAYEVKLKGSALKEITDWLEKNPMDDAKVTRIRKRPLGEVRPAE